MGEYIKTIVSAVLAVGIISVLLPRDSFSKYVNLLSGIIVMAVIVSPVLSLGNENFNISRIDVEELEFNTNSYIMEEYEKELSKNIKEMLKSKVNIDFSVSVRADKKENVIDIKEIEIAPYSPEYAALICDYLGIEEGRITQK